MAILMKILYVFDTLARALDIAHKQCINIF